MPTIIGVIFFVVGAYFFIKKEDCLVGLLIFASIFQAASAINIAERGIQPYYVIATFIIVRAIVNRLFLGSTHRSMPGGRWLLIFTAIALGSAFVYPFIFAGIPVYDPKIGIDSGLFVRPALHFGINNVAQAGFLAWHVATAYASLSISTSIKKLRKAYLWAFSLVGLFLCTQFLAQLIGVTLPDSFLRNNPGYAIAGSEFLQNGTRNSATFSEPSMAGTFIVVYAVGFIAEYLAGTGGTGQILAGLACIGLVASSGSLAALAFCMLLLLFLHSPLRFPWYIQVRQLKRVVWLLLAVLGPVTGVLLVSAGYRQTLLDFTVSKGDSGSFLARTAADIYALGLVVQTYGIGVGLGSNRASSMATTLLSNVGVVGFVSFLVFYYKVFASISQDDAWLRWAGLAVLLNVFLGVADVTIPLLWTPILFAIQLSPKPKAWVPLEKPMGPLVTQSC